jgi:hypothetical protein
VTEPDYPAAHSMDSCWFAVDRDGRVGFFQTGEAGAQPTRGLSGPPAERARHRITQEAPGGDFEVDLRGRLLPYLWRGGIRHLHGGSDSPVLTFMNSLDPVQDLLASGLAIEVKARDGFAVLWPHLPDAEQRRLHRGDPAVCQGCFWAFELLEGQDPEYRAQLARHGVYVFSALGGNAAANPYGVQLIPARPVHVDQLPPDLRARLKEVQFEAVSFADTPVLQPAEHVPCTAHEPVYTDMKGRAHPLPEWSLDDVMEAEEYRRRRDELMLPEEDGDRPAG